MNTADQIVELSIPGWLSPVRDDLERKILPAYLKKIRWFGGKGKPGFTVRIAKEILKYSDAQILLLDIDYSDGTAERYQLPVKFCPAAGCEALKRDFPQAIIAENLIAGDNCVLVDAVYDEQFQHGLLTDLAEQKTCLAGYGEIRCRASDKVAAYTNANRVGSKVLSADQSNTAIVYDHVFFAKVFRKVDNGLNPDVEISRFLTGNKFSHIPEFLGSVEWADKGNSMALVMVQNLVEKSSDAWKWFLEHLNNAHRTLAGANDLDPPPPQARLTARFSYDEIPFSIRSLFDPAAMDGARLLGVRTAEMHKALASSAQPEFQPERFTNDDRKRLLNEAGLLLDSTISNQQNNLSRLSPKSRHEAETLLSQKEKIRENFRTICEEGQDVSKIRVHGDYHLGQVMVKDGDFMIIDFEGEPGKPFAERRNKRVALQDVAGMVRSFHYAGYGSVFLNKDIESRHCDMLLRFAEQWSHYICRIFITAYLDAASGSAFIPTRREDVDRLLTFFLLEKAVYELNYEINNRPDWVVIPLKAILSLI